jgi:hypothetical protein
MYNMNGPPANIPPSIFVPVNKEGPVKVFHVLNMAHPAGAGPSRYENSNAHCGSITEWRTFEAVNKHWVEGSVILKIDSPGRVAWVVVIL